MKYLTAQDLDPDYKPPPKKPRVSARLQVPSSAFYFRGFWPFIFVDFSGLSQALYFPLEWGRCDFKEFICAFKKIEKEKLRKGKC